jgi:DNA-binding MarR family transcriptional regulator
MNKDRQRPDAANNMVQAKTPEQPDDGKPHPDIADDIGRMLVRINRLRRRFMAERMKPFNLVGPSYMLILSLSCHPGESQDFLAARHAMDKGNVAHMVKQLVRLGYVMRETDPADRRRYKLFLTSKGEDMAGTIRTATSEWNHKISESFTNSEWQVLHGFLQRILDNGNRT